MNRYLTVCIDDDEQFLRSLSASVPEKVQALCRDFECPFEFVASDRELFELLADEDEDCPLGMIISDQLMPGASGIELIEKIKADRPNVVSVLLTGHAGLESAKYAINHHILDQYVSKPIEDIEEFVSIAANLLKRHHLDREERERTAQLDATVEQLRQSNQKIRALQAAAERVAKLSKGIKCLDMNEVVDLIIRDVPKILNAERGVLVLVPNGGPEQPIRRYNCPSPEDFLQTRSDGRETMDCGCVFYGDVPDVCKELGSKRPCIVIPLALSGVVGSDGKPDKKPQGFLCVCGVDDAGGYPEDVLRYEAELLSEILSAGLTNARLYARAKQESEIDPLTGVGSRRVLEAQLRAEQVRVSRYQHPCCVVILDVDHFKQINDEAGHMVGDQVLRDLADILRGEIREVDTVGRFGGDEFVIMMPETDLDQATQAAERIREHVAADLRAAGQPLTVSCGVARWSADEKETSAEIMRRADAALYSAKTAGRNRVATS